MPDVTAILDAIAMVAARHPLPGARIGPYAVPAREVGRGQTVEQAAAEYLTWLRSVMGGDVRAALAAYAEGPHLRPTWIQLGRDWDALRLVLDDRAVAFVEAVMAEVNRHGQRAGSVHR